MIARRPIIGVTGPDRGGGAAWWFTRLAVWLAGGRALRITPARPRGIEGLDGLIIGGGADVNPKLYGQELTHADIARPADQPTSRWTLSLLLLPVMWAARKLAAVHRPLGGDAARDALEMKLIGDAVRRGLPILGICRGEQLLNVHFAGTLHQRTMELYVEEPHVRTILPRKGILVEQGTKLSRVIGRRPGRVNALHRHAIDRLGRGVRVAARDRNGIVQAIEHESLPFVVGVQWHPEYLPQVPQQRAIFRALVEHAARAATPAHPLQPSAVVS